MDGNLFQGSPPDCGDLRLPRCRAPVADPKVQRRTARFGLHQSVPEDSTVLTARHSHAHTRATRSDARSEGLVVLRPRLGPADGSNQVVHGVLALDEIDVAR